MNEADKRAENRRVESHRVETHRDDGLDLLRSFAILAVLFLHAGICIDTTPEAIGRWFSYGWLGVDLFFVLSGFLIGHQALHGAREADGLLNCRIFWIKRWFRTLPLYFTVLFFYVVVKGYALGYPFRDEVWPFFFFFQNFTSLSDFVQSWSLCIEEQFYIFLPLIVYIFFPRVSQKAWFWLLPLAASIGLRFWILKDYRGQIVGEQEMEYLIRYPTYLHLDGVSIGVFLASTFATWSRWKSAIRGALGFFGFALLGLTAVSFGPLISPENGSWYFFFASVSFALLLICFKGRSLPAWLSGPVYWIAVLSYGTYLWNNLFMRVFEKLPNILPWYLEIFAFMAVVHALAFVTYRLVEQPFMRLRSGVLGSLGRGVLQKPIIKVDKF